MENGCTVRSDNGGRRTLDRAVSSRVFIHHRHAYAQPRPAEHMASSPTSPCPVDPETRNRWLAAARASDGNGNGNGNGAPSTPSPPAQPRTRFSLDTGAWHTSTSTGTTTHTRAPTLPTTREVSSIPRGVAAGGTELNAAERAALPANSETDTGHDRDSGHWVYPSAAQFAAAMQRKGRTARAGEVARIVPIHNAVNERAWGEIRGWEEGRGGCGGPRLVRFAGDSKALTPRAWWNGVLGYERPFDRHDWVVDRCGTRVEYVIDFYGGRGGGLGVYLDVRPKVNTWAGVKTRVARFWGM